MSFTAKISAYNRKRKWDIFRELINPSKESTILDVGFNEVEFSNVDNYLEKNYPYPENITALGVEGTEKFSARYPKVNAVNYDGRYFPFKDKEFNVCWSNAVIEHVGDKEKQLLFIKEINRVSEIAFITTPNRNFPVEVHTKVALIHLLPKKLFDKYLSYIGKSWAAGDYMYLLSLNDIKQLLKMANISSYKIIKNKLFFFTLDFIIIFGDQQSCIKNRLDNKESAVKLLSNLKTSINKMLNKKLVKK